MKVKIRNDKFAEVEVEATVVRFNGFEGFKFCAHQTLLEGKLDPDSVTISEVTTGTAIAHDFNKMWAREAARKRLERAGVEKLREEIEKMKNRINQARR